MLGIRFLFAIGTVFKTAIFVGFFIFFSSTLTIRWLRGTQNSGCDPARLYNMTQVLEHVVMQMLTDLTKTTFLICHV